MLERTPPMAHAWLSGRAIEDCAFGANARPILDTTAVSIDSAIVGAVVICVIGMHGDVRHTECTVR